MCKQVKPKKHLTLFSHDMQALKVVAFDEWRWRALVATGKFTIRLMVHDEPTSARFVDSGMRAIESMICPLFFTINGVEVHALHFAEDNEVSQIVREGFLSEDPSFKAVNAASAVAQAL